MYIGEIRIENFRCFGDGQEKLVLPLRPGLTALVGENDTGKTAVIDALRFVLGTRDQEYFRVEERDFHWPPGSKSRRKKIHVRCRFEGLIAREKGGFAEYLTYEKNEDEGGVYNAILYVNWTVKDRAGARSGRRFISPEFRAGENGDGPSFDAEARDLLRATYLRPLRDAERALSSGRGSRLSQILKHTKEIRDVGDNYDPANDPRPDPDTLSVLGVGDYASALLGDRKAIKEVRERLNKDYLKPLSFSGDDLSGHIAVGNAGDNEMRLRQLLEKLELELRNEATPDAPANRGLGSNNLLFMACELLLLGSEEDGLPLLLIEEPEAHLHPQRQIRLIQFLQEQAEIQRPDGRKIQIIVTTHSPNLASAIKLDNLVLIQDGKGYSLAAGQTELSPSDCRFLERFLDVTKANLFFARGVVIVEGDAENILLPTLARLIGRDFGAHGVSIVNVGGTGLRRFARIFQRQDSGKDGEINVPVACLTDLDVMPDCAPEIIGLVEEGQQWKEIGKRRWRAKSDYDDASLAAKREGLRAKASGQKVETFVADEWTLEYDLAFFGLAKDVWIAAHLAKADERINAEETDKKTIETEAAGSFTALCEKELDQQQLASNVYALFTTGTKASKAIAAQYLAERLETRVKEGTLTAQTLKDSLPSYLVAALEYVTPIPDEDGDGDTAAAQIVKVGAAAVPGDV